jgi:membrane fusion protein
MSRNLFRQEALDFKKEKLFGEVMQVHHLSYSFLTAVAVCIAASVIVFAFWGDYTRKAHVVGYLAPSKGLIKVYAPQAGTLIEKFVVEGRRVTKGDPLFILSTERSSRETPEAQAAAIAQLKQRRESLKEELAKQQSIDQIQYRSLQDRISGMDKELAQIESEMATQRLRLASAESVAVRYQDLLAKGFVAEIQAREKREELLDQQSRLQGLERNRLELERELTSARRELASSQLRFRNQRAAIERNISSLEQELTEHESQRNIVITAPGDGTVTTILVEQGQNANTTNPLLSILPEGAVLEAQLLVPSRAVGFIEPEQTVSLRYQAFPYQRFGSHKGRVREISRTLITPNEANLPVNLEESVYRVTVSLDSQAVKAYRQDVPLQSGMLVDADIWLDHRRIVDWIFDPLYSITGRL